MHILINYQCSRTPRVSHFNELVATCVNCPLSGQPGHNRKAITFDGVNDTLLVAHDDELELDDATFMAWIKSNTANGALLSMRDGSGTHYTWQLGGNSMLLTVGVTTESLAISVADGSWHHLALSMNDGVWTGYVDGVATGSTTGGGAFKWPGTDDETSFGFSMEYNKKLQGRLMLVYRLPDDSVYRLKSNALDGLALGEAPGGAFTWASFTGKTTFQSPQMASPEGNHSFIAYVEDHGTSGDRFWLQVKDKAGAVVWELSMADPAEDVAIEIDGDNANVSVEAQSVSEHRWKVLLPIVMGQ